VAEVWGAILRFLGASLSGIYKVIPSYGVAIILLTLILRVILIPLTVKQIRSMSAMQRLQPELKRLQQKYKGDRQKLNEEMMKLYREHGVNPLGGCFPLLMQFPVFIALYSVLRVAVVFEAALPQPTAATVSFGKETVCAPVGTPAPTGPGFTTIRCEDAKTSQEFQISPNVVQEHTNPIKKFETLPSYVTHCAAALDTDKKVTAFVCSSPKGTGHLPTDGRLFRDITRDKATFLGMHLACSPTQASTKIGLRQCTVGGKSAGAGIVPYYILIAFMMASTYFQQKQMSAQASGPQAKQMQTMGRVMPLILGFVSLSVPTGAVIYWTVSNVWTIGQQYLYLQRQQPPPGAAETATPGKGKPPTKPKPKPKPKR
jgi:YidC/Oxa1 family membrane protein insertase